MHRDHGFHNLLGTEDGVITKVIDWGSELSYEPLGVSLGRIEQYVKDSTELRKGFWDCFTAAIRHFLTAFPDLWRAMKTTKDVGFVVSTLKYCKDQAEVTAYHWSRLEGVLLKDDCINELKMFPGLEEN
jgi:hypothetical protein